VIASGRLWWLIAIPLIALPYLLAGWASQEAGYLDDQAARTLAKAIVAREQWQLDAIGFDSPPLPALLLLIHPSIQFLVLLTSLLAGALGAIIARDLFDSNLPRSLAILILASGYFGTMNLLPGSQQPATLLGLLLLYLSFRAYTRYLLHGLTLHAFQSRLLSGLAYFATPVALPITAAFAALLPFYHRSRMPYWHWFSASAVLLFRCPPWRAKRRRVVPGSREATRDTRRAEGAKGDPKGASERGVQSYGRPVCRRNELAMLWRKAG